MWSRDHVRVRDAWEKLRLAHLGAPSVLDGIGWIAGLGSVDDWVARVGAARGGRGCRRDIHYWRGATRLADLSPAQARCARRRINGWLAGVSGWVLTPPPRGRVYR